MKRNNIIKLSVILIVVLLLGLWVKGRWNVWFVNLPETNYSTAILPDRITLVPGENFATERIITWRCDTVLRESYLLLVNGNDTLKYKADGNIVENVGGKDAIYNVELDKLQPSAKYFYRVISGNKESGWYSFSMPDNKGISKLIYFGDVQDTIGGKSKQIFREIFARNKDVDVVLFGGDLLERPLDKYWNYTYDSLDSIIQQYPIMTTAGNHEYKKGLLSYLDNRWRKSFHYADNGADAAAGSYYIDAPNILFIVLDTQSFVKLYPVITQANWIKKVVKEKGDGKIKIVIMHHPVNSVRKGKSNFFEKHFFRSIFNDLKVDIVLAGHEHNYGRFINDDGSVIPLYVVSHCSVKNYPSVEPTAEKKIIHGVPMYQTFEFLNNKIIFKAFDAKTNKMLDSFTIKK